MNAMIRAALASIVAALCSCDNAQTLMASQAGSGAGAVTEATTHEFPCINELCIGDGVDKLATIAWTDYEVASRPKGWSGSLDLPSVGLDGAAIAKLVSSSVACTRPWPKVGAFWTKSGHPTLVKVELMVNGSDVTQQRWLVSAIEREYRNLSAADMARMEQDLVRKYEPFILSFNDMANFAAQNHRHVPVQAAIALVPNRSYAESVLLHLGGEEIAQWHPVDYERHPDCGGRGNAPLTTD